VWFDERGRHETTVGLEASVAVERGRVTRSGGDDPIDQAVADLDVHPLVRSERCRAHRGAIRDDVL
jgi:hypothetical protein